MSTDHKLTSKQKLARLKEALLEDSSRSALELHERLENCRAKWQDNRFTCRSPACPSCRRAYIRSQQAETRNFFACAANPDLAYLSVVLGGTSDAERIADITQKGKTDTRNCIRAGRSGAYAPLWNRVMMKAWIEVDAIGVEHMPVLGSDRRALLGEIAPMRLTQNCPNFVPTYHAVVNLGGLGLGEVYSAFVKQWSVPGQVDLRPLHRHRTVEQNLDRLVSYSNKHLCRIQLGHVQEPWPVSWQSDFYAWLHNGRRNAFEALRFEIGQKKPKNVVKYPLADVVDNLEEVEPMYSDYGFTILPMYI